MAAGRPRAPRVTVSTMASGAPASPVDQDIWIATAVDAGGTRWGFQYNAGSASAFKWEYIGGAGVIVRIETSESTASAAFVDLATVGPSITLARAGDYQLTFGFAASGNSGGNAVGEAFVGGTDLGVGVTIQAVNAAGGVFGTGTEGRVLGRAAADVVKLKYNVSNGVSTNFQNRWLRILPVRVS